MGLKRVEERLLRLSNMVNKWNGSGQVSRIERDLALDELRQIYDALLGVECGTVAHEPQRVDAPHEEQKPAPRPVAKQAPKPKAEPKREPEPVAEPEPQNHKADPVADFDDALDIDALLGITDDEPQPMAEPAAETVEVQQNPGGGLFAIEDIPVRNKSSRKMINLYTSSVASQPSEQHIHVEHTPYYEPQPYHEPQRVETSAESVAPQRVGDVLGSGKRVVGDMQSVDNAPIAPMNKITDLRKAIGLNDKFLLLRDLFNGDVPLYERTIDTLNAFEDLDECMIYIVENFRWNPDSEGAKMLVSLIERKLS